jgi:multiple sugar transport system substrate-binding protein
MWSKMQGTKGLSRRSFLRGAALIGGSAVLSACTPRVVKETVVVQETVMVEGTPQVVEKVVTATPPPKERRTIVATTPLPVENYDPIAYDMVKALDPNIDFRMERTVVPGGFAEYADKIITKIAGGEPLDLIFIAQDQMAVLTTNNILRSLVPLLAADETARVDLEEDVHPVLMKAMQWKGDQRLIPIGWNNSLTFYHPTIFKETGVPEPTRDWTWDGFLETCLAVADVKGTESDRYAYMVFPDMYNMCGWLYNNDTEVLKNDETDSNIDDPKVAETLQFLADLILKHKVAPDFRGFNAIGQFISGNLAMFPCSAWCFQAWKNGGLTDYALQYAPHRAGPYRTILGLIGYGMATLCKYPDEAWTVLKVLCSPEIQALDVNTQIPARRSVAESPVWQNVTGSVGLDVSIFYESLDYAKTQPNPPNMNAVVPIFERWVAQMFTGGVSVEDGVKGLHAELQAEMDRIKM